MIISDHTKGNCPKIDCYNCHGKGHMSTTCPNKKQNKKLRHLGTPEKKRQAHRQQSTPDKNATGLTVESIH